ELEVQTHTLRPLLFRRIPTHGPRAAGVVDQNVEPAERREHAIANAFDTAVARQVLGHDERARAAGLHDLRGQLLEKVAAPRDDCDPATLGRHHFRRAAADTTAGAGDEAGLVLQL